MSERLKGKVAIVTGGAKGIGLAIVNKFTDEGAKVVATDVDEKAKSNIDALNKEDSVLFFKQDVSDSSTWPAVFDFAKQHFGTVTTVVNNAGVGANSSIENTTDKEWRKVLGVNLDGVFYGTREGIKQMKNSPNGGSIINMASIEALVGDPGLGAYNASKGGTMLLTKSAAVDCALRDYGVRVNSVHPGYISTPMVQAHPELEAAMADRTKTPVGHLGEPNDIAYMCVYLASDESKFATGAQFTVDGGYTAQ
ncbi:glucose 1-dehydrogenase [Ligilactobacillus pobuzihii]|uniref:glucose 1-dehydrogenase n=1 Tax=Ligilactobacillus pobuzihii TaxID=449659 RepID=UPI0019CFEBB3|nr:glucose 1-dehydrogenase [Ligilactobacillus pobuzihii]MBN7274067.1 glucose 1-dehydrogenase [Ligilactobacillus pobuzihii]HIZ95266.1 glucose 1-dehydrogenase [Candidatus Ligilactobacillus excrementavium]